jgi:hypothetical protein
MNNPMQLFQMFKNSSNPMMLVSNMAKNNPQLQNLMNNLQGKDTKQLEEYAKNLAQSRGIDLKQFLSQFGVNIK